LIPANSTSGDASWSTNPILHGEQEVGNQTQVPNDELQDTETSPTAPGDTMASEECPIHDNDVPRINLVSPSRNELLVQGTDGGGLAHCVVLPRGIDGVDMASVSRRPMCIQPPMHPMLIVPDPSPHVRASDTVQSEDELLFACLQSFERNHASLASKMALPQGNVIVEAPHTTTAE
jgi:hypothetical protein